MRDTVSGGILIEAGAKEYTSKTVSPLCNEAKKIPKQICSSKFLNKFCRDMGKRAPNQAIGGVKNAHK
jgi:hypothetical protein